MNKELREKIDRFRPVDVGCPNIHYAPLPSQIAEKYQDFPQPAGDRLLALEEEYAKRVLVLRKLYPDNSKEFEDALIIAHTEFLTAKQVIWDEEKLDDIINQGEK